jgi:hypothetical protein
VTDGSGGAPWETRPFAVSVSAKDVRSFVGLPADTDPPGSTWARQVGRPLHPMLASPRNDGLDVVLDVLDQARSLLVAVGVHFDVIRIRRGCAVVRAMPLGKTTAGSACEVSRGLLETVPAMARGIRGTVVETTCRERGAEACLYTLLWDATLGVMALYRPYSRHGPWAAQSGGDVTFLLDRELTMPQPAPTVDPASAVGPGAVGPGAVGGLDPPGSSPPVGREPDPDGRGGT